MVLPRLRNLAAALAIGLVPWLAMAQQGTPTPTPTPDEDVIKISSNLIQFDVSVVDKNGKPIRDLRPDEIEVYQNGRKRTLTSLDFVSTGAVTTADEKPLVNST